ncbi:hypothetical protein Amet_2617 [Alkaliphilus metalliredigens QYMF]|uniref:Uncharacterized protein n=1 Tax=Alkaliphilus metalliredigens (strain QYMF) TaxID=293826 RepID=A6TRF1_ALKMQ|nr:hypothetical protein [Alkaliphilus metalliredigens]ABR48769.1 hypothetical protein Amet_2617 [Alkaliphilus metalliredigens QYMF]
MGERKHTEIAIAELEKQHRIMEELKVYYNGKGKKYIIITYGCQMNSARCI